MDAVPGVGGKTVVALDVVGGESVVALGVVGGSIFEEKLDSD